MARRKIVKASSKNLELPNPYYNYNPVFNSAHEIAEYIADLPADNYSISYDRPSFCNISHAEAVTLLQSGWSDGSKDIDIKTNAIKGAMVDTITPIYQYDKTGLFFDVATYLEGGPDCFLTVEQQEFKKEKCRIVVNIGVSAYRTENEIKNRGAAILVVIDKLYATHDIDLSFVMSVKNARGYDIDITINVNTQNGYSRDLISFIVCHPAMLRRVLFSVMEKATGQKTLGDYGGLQNRLVDMTADIYFPFMETDDYDDIASAAAAVQKIIDKMEVE